MAETTVLAQKVESLTRFNTESLTRCGEISEKKPKFFQNPKAMQVQSIHILEATQLFYLEPWALIRNRMEADEDEFNGVNWEAQEKRAS